MYVSYGLVKKRIFVAQCMCVCLCIPVCCVCVLFRIFKASYELYEVQESYRYRRTRYPSLFLKEVPYGSPLGPRLRSRVGSREKKQEPFISEFIYVGIQCFWYNDWLYCFLWWIRIFPSDFIVCAFNTRLFRNFYLLNDSLSHVQLEPFIHSLF